MKPSTERDESTSRQLVLGLGGCVDFEVIWDAQAIADLAIEYGIGPADLDPDLEVHDERTLVRSILAFVRDGVGGERYIASSAIAVQFASRLSCKVTLGGTGVRAALAVARMGVPSLVHLTSIDDNVRRLLAPGIDYLSSATSDTLDPHLIVQYPAGVVDLVGGEVRAEHANRIIYVNDPPNRNLELSADLPDALRRAEAFLVAGLNVMRDPDLLRDRLRFLRRAMELLPAGAAAVYEDAGFHDPDLRRIVSRELRGRVDVHSLNEDELQCYLGRRIDLLDPEEVASALAEFSGQAMAETVIVHTRHWALAYGAEPMRWTEALAGGIDLASTRYCFGDDFEVADLDAVRRLPESADGLSFADRIRTLAGERVGCVPGRLLDVPRPTTVGLGDTFVGGLLATLVHGRLPIGSVADDGQTVSPASE